MPTFDLCPVEHKSMVCNERRSFCYLAPSGTWVLLFIYRPLNQLGIYGNGLGIVFNNLLEHPNSRELFSP